MQGGRVLGHLCWKYIGPLLLNCVKCFTMVVRSLAPTLKPYTLGHYGCTFDHCGCTLGHYTVANISALLHNIDLEPQTQSRMQRKFTEVSIRG